jgi:2-methylcitrate dehydratase PrpD
MTVTAELARFAASLRYEDLPEDLVERMRKALLDGLAIMLGAADFGRVNGDRELTTYLDDTAPSGASTVVGFGRRTTPMMAAFANGSLCEVLDYQDCNLTARIHNGSAVTPAVLALAEASGASGRDVLTAMLAGFEVGTRLGHAVQPAHWHRGFQMTGTFGTSGAAAAAGRLLGLSAEAMASALGVSGFIMPVSNGDNVFKGHSVKPVHGGQPALCGISSAYLAKAGYGAGPLEGEEPRHHAALRILGDGNPDIERAVAGLGETWATRELAFKPYPIGLLIIGPVEVILDQLTQHRRDHGEVAAIEVRSYHDAWKFTGEKYTTTESNFVDAHLSIPYCIAAALMDGTMTPRQFDKKRLCDPAVHALARRVTVAEDDEMSARYPHEWPVEVTLVMSGGERLRGAVDQVKWSPRRPPSWDDLAAKFAGLAEPVIGSAKVGQAIDFVAAVDRADTIGPLMDIVRGTD